MEDSAEIRAAVQMAVIKVLGANKETSLTARATATVAELTLQFVRCSLAPNLDAFAQHASRRRITEQDVLLSLRNHDEYRQKVLEKLEHFKRTTNILAAPDLRAKRPQARLAAKRAGPSTDSSGSSSSDESNTPVPAKKKPHHERNKFDDTFSSSDDGLNAIRSKLTRKKPSGSMTTKKLASKKTDFKFFASPDSPVNQESSTAQCSFPATGIKTQSKRVQEIILENQDDESMPSDCD